MDIEQIKCVLAVESYKTFLDASFHLNRSQSSVSKSIQRLEEELGIRLFDRTTRRVELTPAGRDFVELGRQILICYEGILRSAQAHQKEEFGHLRIGSIYFGRNSRLDPLIAKFVRQYPSVEIDMREGMTTPLMQALRAKELDVVFVSSMYLNNGSPQNFSSASEYHAHSCFRDLYYVVMSKEHPLAEREMLDYKDLEGEALIATDRAMDVYHRAVSKAFESHGVPFTISMYCNSVRSVLYMVSQNLGIAILSKLVIEESDDLRIVPMRDPLVRDTQMVILSQKNTPPHIRAFFQFVQRQEL